MDPLGAETPVVDVERLPRWNTGSVPEYDIKVDDPSLIKMSPFQWDEDINARLVVWSGDITTLNSEAIVNSTNEALSDRSPACERLLNRAGQDLKREIKRDIKVCKTGEAKLSKGYCLPARYVIHTVGPRYNIKYKTAAESALFNSYRSVLQIVRESKMSSAAVCCIHSQRRAYPSEEGSHIAIRTIRRFLERYRDTLQTLVIVVTETDEEIYRNLLALYFPRSKSEEEFAAYHLPYDVGGPDGEPVITDRQIRITGKPTHNTPLPDDGVGFLETVNINEAFETSVAVGAHEFSKMKEDVDKQRKGRLRRSLTADTVNYHRERYERWLRRSREADLSEISRLNCLFHSGFDKYGRAVIVFIGKCYPAASVGQEKALMYFIRLMDGIVNKPYVLVYLHTLTTRANVPELDFLKECYYTVDYRYKRNLQAVYLVHPTFWSRVVTWFFTTFSLADLKPKVQHLKGLEYLFTRIPQDQLDLPQWIIDYDYQMFGSRYYNQEEDAAIGTL